MWIFNRTGHRLRITKITSSLTIDAVHARAGCNRTNSFRVARLPRSAYPIFVPARRTRSLLALGRPLLRVRMLNLGSNQDVCKGAKLHLRFAGRARHWDHKARP